MKKLRTALALYHSTHTPILTPVFFSALDCLVVFQIFQQALFALCCQILIIIDFLSFPEHFRSLLFSFCSFLLQNRLFPLLDPLPHGRCMIRSSPFHKRHNEFPKLQLLLSQYFPHTRNKRFPISLEFTSLQCRCRSHDPRIQMIQNALHSLSPTTIIDKRNSLLLLSNAVTFPPRPQRIRQLHSNTHREYPSRGSISYGHSNSCNGVSLLFAAKGWWGSVSKCCNAAPTEMP